MIRADTIAYNNLPIDVRVGNQLMPRGTPYAIPFEDGIKKKLYQLPVEPFADKNRNIHSANFLNTNGEVLPCYISPSLRLNEVYSDNPNAHTNVYQTKYGNARNQGGGIASDGKQMLLFKKNNLLPDLVSVGANPKEFSKN